MQGEEWDDSMTSVRRIVPKTNEQYVDSKRGGFN